MKYILIVNFKAYEKGVGENALVLSRIAEKVSKETGIEIAVAVQPTDIKMIADNVDIEVLAQHIDPVKYGPHTGSILPEAVKEAGAAGTLLNHSEKQIDIETLERSIKRCKELGMKTIICVDTSNKAEEVARFKPDYISIEPPDLIGGDVSVSTARPELVRDTVKRVKSIADIPVLCGAGVKKKEDVEKAVELGAVGILVASGIVKADNPEKAMLELISGFPR